MSDVGKRLRELFDGKRVDDNPVANACEEAERSGKAFNSEKKTQRNAFAQAAKDSDKARSEISHHFGRVAIIEHTSDGKIIPHVQGVRAPHEAMEIAQAKIEPVAPTRLNQDAEITHKLVKVANIIEMVSAPILDKSEGLVTSKADRLLAGDKDKYNCHFYTDTFVKGQEPGILFFMKDKCIVDGAFLGAHKFRCAATCSGKTFADQASTLREGDVILVRDLNAAKNLNIIHSAVVIRGGENGQPLIRQKFDADNPVVDLHTKQFSHAYLESSAVEISIWRK
jgi:hypothetical protein